MDKWKTCYHWGQSCKCLASEMSRSDSWTRCTVLRGDSSRSPPLPTVSNVTNRIEGGYQRQHTRKQFFRRTQDNINDATQYRHFVSVTNIMPEKSNKIYKCLTGRQECRGVCTVWKHDYDPPPQQTSHSQLQYFITLYSGILDSAI
jgi:hypothetical protein